ncbi:MAG: CDP-alcohol phosphatidyltransferase family protein [Candidatus Omnitrophota bacterium]|nr:MAG: CDP-alcohol phosphatidyltransferase family protein [Candidatus Omnitrophota bacterium]
MNEERLTKYGDIVDRINRGFSLPLAKALLKTPVTPNAITFFRSFLVIAAMYLYLKCSLYAIFTAGILLQLSDIFDYVDGDLARLKNKVTIEGQWLEYLENNFQGTSGTLLGFFVCLGIYLKTLDARIFIILFFLAFGFHMKKALIHTPVKSGNWIFNLMDSSSAAHFKKETSSNIFIKLAKIFLWVSTRDINILFLASVTLPVFYNQWGLSPLYLVLIAFAVSHNLTWIGIAYFQWKAIER